MNFDKVDALGRMRLELDNEQGPFSGFVRVRAGTTPEQLELVGGNVLTDTILTMHGLTAARVAEINDMDFVVSIELSRKLHLS